MKKTITVKVPFTCEIEVLRETDQEELDCANEVIDGEWGGWWWRASLIAPDGIEVDLSSDDDYCETEKDAFEIAKEQLKEYLEDRASIS